MSLCFILDLNKKAEMS